MLETGVVEVINNYVVYAVTIDTAESVSRAKNYVSADPDCTAAELYKAIVIEEYGK